MLRLAALLLALVAAGEAWACPAQAPRGGISHLSARQLATERQAALRAGGPVVLEACAEVPGAGYVPFEPQVILRYVADLPGRGLEIRSEAGCASLLLVRTARGNWYFDEGAGRGVPQIILANPRTGHYQIWVGTRDVFGCDARLVLRTVRPTRAGLRTALR